jgi:hypothetical protein
MHFVGNGCGESAPRRSSVREPTMTTAEITDQILALPPAERAAIAQRVCESIEDESDVISPEGTDAHNTGGVGFSPHPAGCPCAIWAIRASLTRIAWRGRLTSCWRRSYAEATRLGPRYGRTAHRAMPAGERHHKRRNQAGSPGGQKNGPFLGRPVNGYEDGRAIINNFPTSKRHLLPENLPCDPIP